MTIGGYSPVPSGAGIVMVGNSYQLSALARSWVSLRPRVLREIEVANGSETTS